MRVADLVSRHASARPNEPALICGPDRLSWRQLDERTDALAAKFASVASPGDRVVIVTAACHRHWEVVFAASKAALVSVPLNFRWTPSELADTIAEVEPAVLVVDHRLASGTGPDLLDLAPTPVILGFGGDDDRAEDYEVALEAGYDLPPANRGPWPHNAIGFTSGTTGRPQGAVLAQQHAFSSAMWLAALFGIRAEDCFLSCMPMYVYRAGSGGLAPIMMGARSVLCDFDVDTVLDAIERERATHMILAPIMVDRLLASPRIAGVDLGSLRGVWVGGAPSSANSIERLQELVGDIVGSVYGGTEATAVASMRWPLRADRPELLSSIGRAAPVNDVRLITGEGAVLGSGEPGEIQVKGPTVMSGYWPDVDGAGLIDGWYATGDIAIQDDEGYLYLVDRRADVINSGGLNVYSVEVERVLLAHPQVAECAIVGAPDAELGEMVTAIVVPSEGDMDIDVLSAHCRAGLAGYKCPRQWLVRASLARNAMGKTDKRRLRDELWADSETNLGGARLSADQLRTGTSPDG